MDNKEEILNIRNKLNQIQLDVDSPDSSLNCNSDNQIIQQQSNLKNQLKLDTGNNEKDENVENVDDEKEEQKKKYIFKPLFIPGSALNSSTYEDCEKSPIYQYKNVKCNYCNEIIDEDDNKILIGSMFYHEEHLLCCKCGCKLSRNKILEFEENIYCEKCFDVECDLDKKLCGYCNKEIIGDIYIKALNKVWHQNHFFCSHCGCEFDENLPFVEYDGKPYCEEDYNKLFGTICRFCNEIISDEYVEAMDMFWHSHCFNCQVCKESLLNKVYYCVEGMLYCEKHYQEKEGLLCEYCKQPVDKRYVSALNKKWHPNHFFCNYCKNVLYVDKMGYRQHKDKPYCMDCYIRLFG